MRRIIDNYVYCGHSVSLKTVTTSYRDHTKVRNEEQNWITVRNTHEAIIDEKTFELAQAMRRQGRRFSGELHDKGPLHLMIYCADCGGRMSFHNYHNCPNTRGGFFCTNHQFYKICSPHSIPRSIIEAGVLENLQQVLALANNSEEEFLQMVTR